MRNCQAMRSSAAGSDPGSGSESCRIPGTGSLALISHAKLILAPSAAMLRPNTDVLPRLNDVRVVIYRAPERQISGTGVLGSRYRASASSATQGVATRGQWPKPRGYKGRPYSFTMEEG